MAKLGRVEFGWAEGGAASLKGEIAVFFMEGNDYFPQGSNCQCRLPGALLSFLLLAKSLITLQASA